MEVTTLEDQYDLVPTKKFPKKLAKFPFPEFNPVQSRIVEVYTDDANCVIAAATSAGKAQPDDSLILTPTGYRRLDSVGVGDLVIGRNGLPTYVVGVFPQGDKQVYRVLFNDGTSTRCCKEHLWFVRTRSQKARGKEFTVEPLSKLVDDFKTDKWMIPISMPVEFTERDFVIDPYVLGLLIGDGGIKYSTKFSNIDEDVVSELKKRLPDGVCVRHEKGCDYRICGEVDHYNPLARELDDLSLLGKGSPDKFIPFVYKHSSVSQRMELLRGIMDSDGGGHSNKSPYFDTSSETLAEDVAFVVRSLGGWTRVRKRDHVPYTYRGEKRIGLPCYRMTVVVGENPFFSQRKSSLWRRRKVDKIKTIRAIVPEEKVKCRCIKVANEDGGYITNDFIVTHNTVCAEMYLSHEVRVRGGKGMYLAPLRALAKEKIDDWSNPKHHFDDLNLSICTGDYRLTPARKKELASSNLIMMTSEMLSSRCRNHKSEHNNWLMDVGTLIVDESHLLTVEGRGDHLEIGLMNFCKLNPNCRLVFLSATMPNVEEIAEWVGRLTGKDTYLVNSTYRPVPLGISYEIYDDRGRYDEVEQEKVWTALNIVEEYPDDKFIAFVHTKKTGALLKNTLEKTGIKCEYHSADIEAEKRHSVEKRFREDKELQVVVATSTLAWGLNMPARRVIITGVHRGLSEVQSYDIWQMAGRAGRVGLDVAGDVHILLPRNDFDTQKERISEPHNIESKLLDFVGDPGKERYKTLAFHMVSEIHRGGIKTKEDVHNWYEQTLARHQAQDLEDHIIDSTLESLLFCRAIKEENGEYTPTTTGTIASMFYYSPFDVADLRKNFKILFEKGLDSNDTAVSMMLGHVDSNRMGFVSKAEAWEMEDYFDKVKNMMGGFNGPAVKSGFAYYVLLRGMNPGSFAALSRQFQFDFPRTQQVLQMLDTMGGKWGKKQWLNDLGTRMIYGVRRELVPLCRISDIGKVRAEKLWRAGMKSPKQVADNPEKVKKVLNMSDEKIKSICFAADIIE